MSLHIESHTGSPSWMGAQGRWHGVGMGNVCNLRCRLAMHVAFNSEIPLVIGKEGEAHYCARNAHIRWTLKASRKTRALKLEGHL